MFALVEAARQLADEGALPVNVRFAFDGEEEVGGDSIVQWLEQDEGRAVGQRRRGGSLLLWTSAPGSVCNCPKFRLPQVMLRVTTPVPTILPVMLQVRLPVVAPEPALGSGSQRVRPVLIATPNVSR